MKPHFFCGPYSPVSRDWSGLKIGLSLAEAAATGVSGGLDSISEVEKWCYPQGISRNKVQGLYPPGIDGLSRDHFT